MTLYLKYAKGKATEITGVQFREQRGAYKFCFSTSDNKTAYILLMNMVEYFSAVRIATEKLGAPVAEVKRC